MSEISCHFLPDSFYVLVSPSSIAAINYNFTFSRGMSDCGLGPRYKFTIQILFRRKNVAVK